MGRISWSTTLQLSLLAFEGLGAAQPTWVFRHDDGRHGAVASESIECSTIGRNLLARGGNAVDAMVGTTLCVGVIGMYHSGIGGGGFMVIRDSEGEYEVVDFRETAPAAAYENMYEDNVEGSIYGGLSAGVPGEVRGLEYAHNKYGVLPWETVVAPAVEVARNGFRVSEDLVNYMARSITERNFLVEDPAWAEDFAPNGHLVRVGETITRKRYANTLEKIGKYGADSFYTGEIAESMIATIQGSNGTMTLEDLEDYKVVIREPVMIDFRGLKLVSSGAPSSGAVMLSMFKIMEQYDADGWEDVDLSIHRFDEAMRFAYGARQELGDPAFVPKVEQLEETMTGESWARKVRKLIMDNQTQPVESYDPASVYTTNGEGTSHIVTADKSGMAVSLTTTINLLFGSQLIDPVTGIILNNEMNDFSIPNHSNEFGFVPSPENFIRPHKRPLSSITPLITEHPDSTLGLVIGAAGGSRIISATAQVAWHILEHGLSLRRAIREPRFHDQLMPNESTFEYAFDNRTVASMVGRGHNVTWVREGWSAVQAVRRSLDGGFEAGSENRQKNSGGLTL